MIDHDDADIRHLYQRHEHRVAGAADRLMPAIGRRRRRRRALRASGYAAAALAVVVTIGGVTLSVGHHHGPPTSAAPSPSAAATGDDGAPAGFLVVSSLGAEIAVPGDWTFNDFGCHQGDAPTVVRAQGAVLACYTPTPPEKEYAIISSTNGYGADTLGPAAAHLRAVATTVTGVPAMRASGAIENGMYAGWLSIDARDVVVLVRARTAATLEAILSSVRLVDVDQFGCPTRRPESRPVTGIAAPFVLAVPDRISVCYYGDGFGDDRLQASARYTGPAAYVIAGMLNSAPAGSNKDRPAECTHPNGTPPINALLLLHGSTGATSTVAVTFSDCVGRHLDNGRQFRHVTVPLLGKLMADMRSGYGYNPPLD
jgi:hypothetical protein